MKQIDAKIYLLVQYTKYLKSSEIMGTIRIPKVVHIDSDFCFERFDFYSFFTKSNDPFNLTPATDCPLRFDDPGLYKWDGILSLEDNEVVPEQTQTLKFSRLVLF